MIGPRGAQVSPALAEDPDADVIVITVWADEERTNMVVRVTYSRMSEWAIANAKLLAARGRVAINRCAPARRPALRAARTARDAAAARAGEKSQTGVWEKDGYTGGEYIPAGLAGVVCDKGRVWPKGRACAHYDFERHGGEAGRFLVPYRRAQTVGPSRSRKTARTLWRTAAPLVGYAARALEMSDPDGTIATLRRELATEELGDIFVWPRPRDQLSQASKTYMPVCAGVVRIGGAPARPRSR